MALGFLSQKPRHALGKTLRATHRQRFKQLYEPLPVIAGAVRGALVALTSVGSGELRAVFPARLYPISLTPTRSIAIYVVRIAPLAMVAGAGHIPVGPANFGMLGNLLRGSVSAAIRGAKLSARTPLSLLRGALTTLLAAIGVKLWRLIV